jgi:hypothetical protein
MAIALLMWPTSAFYVGMLWLTTMALNGRTEARGPKVLEFQMSLTP